jgi:hypothetical protein
VGRGIGFDDLVMYTVVSGRLNVVKGLKRTNQNVSFERAQHLSGL